MIQTFRKPRTILRKTTAISGIAGAAVLLSLIGPITASAAEPTAASSSAATSSSVEISPEALAQVSEQQISAANSGVEKFSASDLLAQVRDQIETDRIAREKKRAAEARAKAEAEAKAKAKAEADAKAKAEEEAAAKAKADADAAAVAAAAAQAQQSTSSSSTGAPSSARSSDAPSSSPTYTGGGSKNDWLAASGIPQSDWGYVDYIVSHESGWNPNAVNASSGAGGLVQALPCGKVAGGCFDPVSNLKWADSYAKGRYGSWAGAYQFWSSNHWW